MADDKNFEKHEILVKFMQPGSVLAGDTYDEQGNKVKNALEPFTKQEIQDLQSRGIIKLYYIKELPKPQADSPPGTAPAEEKVLSLKHPDFLSELDRRPRLLCANISPENFEFYMPRIIANGIALFSTDNISLAEEAFGKYNITHFLLDTDIDGGRWLDLVKGVSEKRDRFQTFLLYGLSTNHLEEYKTKVQVSKTYDKGMDKKELVKKMIEDINSSDPDFSSRSHLKVLVTEEEPVKVSIYIREDQVIEGLGYSISPLEIVLRLIKDVKGEMYNFSKGDSLERVSVTVFGKISLTQAEVTNLDHANQRITLKFTHRSESLLGGIGKLILNKLKTVTL